MDIKKIILDTLKDKGDVRVADIIRITGFSRAYINRFFQDLREEGYLILSGKANKSKYVSPIGIESEKRNLTFQHVYKNTNLNEDKALDDIKRGSAILDNTRENVYEIFSYAFLEIFNNAIEHSQSITIMSTVSRDDQIIKFDITDNGTGIYENIRSKKGLESENDAIDFLLKGKLTTSPEAHSGEGIFFTSRASDTFVIESGTKKILFDNLISDVFIKTIKPKKGTRVRFSIRMDSERSLSEVFRKYTDDSMQFTKTEVFVRLHRLGSELVSRSIARRVLSGLDRFTVVTLDFTDIDTIGQGFADEVFRVWKIAHPHISLIPVNANPDVLFMINHVTRE
jgi:anti-sigma regulatory factor (Ser/Thr protein kinase)